MGSKRRFSTRKEIGEGGEQRDCKMREWSRILTLWIKGIRFLNELEKEALANYVPIIRREMQSFLKVLLQIKAPLRILEVGTAVGFSTLLMSTYAPKECKIVTIENYEKRIPIAKENFKKAGKRRTNSHF